MIVVTLVCVFCLGLSILNWISREFSVLEKIGAAFLIGTGAETIFMFIFQLIHVRFTLLLLLGLNLIVIVLFNVKHFPDYVKQIKQIKIPRIQFKNYNLVWLFFFVLVLFLLFGSAAKSLYWPTSAYDNVTGYDLMAKVMGHEGKITNSLFEINNSPISGSAKRLTYPPLVAGSFAIAYLSGLKTSKIITSLFFISFILLFYSVLQYYMVRTGAIIITFLMMASPEMFAFSSLSTTNVPVAIYASLAVIYLFLWFDKKEKKYLLLSSVLMACTVWTRSDAIIFVFAAGILLFYDAVKNKTWKELVVYSVVAALPFIAWNLFVRFSVNVEEFVFIPYPFIDIGKISAILGYVKNLITSTNLFGISFYLFFLAILVNIRNLSKDRTRIFLVLTVLSWLFFTFIYYQMDNTKMDSLNTMMNASYRRGLFAFVPLIWFYTGINKTARTLFGKLESVLNV